MSCKTSKKYWQATILWLFSVSIVVASTFLSDWDMHERALLGAILGLQVLDVVQTQQMTCGGGFQEIDFFTRKVTGKRAAWYETTPIKTAVLLPALYFIDCYTSSGWFRKSLLVGIMAISADPVLHNEHERSGSNYLHIQLNYLF